MPPRAVSKKKKWFEECGIGNVGFNRLGNLSSINILLFNELFG